MNCKLMFTILTSIFIFLLVLTGCQSKKENEMLMGDVSDIKEISISKSTVFGKLNNEFFATLEDSKELDTIKNAFLTAKREKEELEDVNYDLLITDYKGDNWLLQCYLGEEGEQSAFFYIGHEDRVYFTSEEITQELRKIIKP
ncbi:hypothetical protein FOC75_27760 (plasmid) [Bacillus cereus]|uniref:hypothetical protein n=1 Tax=Bacillus cereus group TaxID=86661 RepID=UPI0005A314DB|nr:hypothetical protein [Bacillus cereus]AJH60281.1 hypothetical protein BG11_5550 [Bacillus cereus]AJK37592.1 hypothetical protein BF33_5711 [Bacillus cereus]QKH69353.1 hypothetical protein FOC75_27760 [Bacillus cereus]QKH71450.1 hypothetical protein FOC74_00105 [Bacillus cereus]